MKFLHVHVGHLVVTKHAIALILAAHLSAAFDGSITNYGLHHTQYTYEKDPFQRPFAGHPTMYFTINADALIVDYMLLRHPHSKAAAALALGVIANHVYGGVGWARAINNPQYAKK
jgi:hypothetical protein